MLLVAEREIVDVCEVVSDAVGDRVVDLRGVAELQNVPEGVALTLMDRVTLTEPVLDTVTLGVFESAGDRDGVVDTEREPDVVGERDDVVDVEKEPETDGDVELDAVTETVTVVRGDLLALRDTLGDAVSVVLTDTVGDTEGELLGEAECDSVTDTDWLGESVPDVVNTSENEAAALSDADRLADRVIDTLFEFVTDPDIDALTRPDPETDVDTRAEIVRPGDGVSEDDVDGLNDGDADMEIDTERD
jgi:hypothetical protein